MSPDEKTMLLVNGKAYPAEAGLTVARLLESVHTGPGAVVIEKNGEIIPREQFGQTPLNAGDRIEIVHFVGGG